MVDKYLTCTRPGCGGVMERLGDDTRSKTIKFKCNKCGQIYTISRNDYNIGRYTFLLNDPRDPLRGGLK
jgi:hypothetical protein